MVLFNIDLAAMVPRFSQGAVGYILAGVLLLVINIPIVGLRWWLLLRRAGLADMSPGYAIGSTFAASFIGQITPGIVGPDAVRGWLCVQKGARWQVIVASLLSDHLLALAGLCVTVGIGLALEADAIGRESLFGIAIAGATVLGAALAALWILPAIVERLRKLWTWPANVHELATMLRVLAFSPAAALGVVLSFAVFVITSSAVLLCARGFDIVLAPSVAYVVVPAAILAAMLPISIAGWGVREASLAFGLTSFGMAADDAALLALLLGLSLLMASLPGAIATVLLGWRIPAAVLHQGSAAEATAGAGELVRRRAAWR
jgi:uncharacterized membrane protein YbhN (UPF0104 family)